MKQLLPNKVYDVLKYLCVIGFPTMATFYGRLAEIWNLPYPDKIPQTINDIAWFIGALVCISAIQYSSKSKEKDEEKDETVK